MPQVGEKRADGKVWAGDDFGWQLPATIWKKQPAGKVGDTRTLPGLGTKVYTGTDYGWQLQSTIDKKKQPDPKPTPTPTPTPKPEVPKPEKKYQFTVGDKSFDLTKAQINQTYRDPKALGGINAVDFGRAANQAIYQFKKPGPSNLMKRYTQPSVEKEAYDVVLDYLLSEGHADTIEEAHYVMMQLDSEYIQSIVEN